MVDKNLKMKFIKNIFIKKEAQTSTSKNRTTIVEFWNWFKVHESRFHRAVKKEYNIQFKFINPVFSKLNQIKEDAFLLTGKMDKKTTELVFTAEGDLQCTYII